MEQIKATYKEFIFFKGNFFIFVPVRDINCRNSSLLEKLLGSLVGLGIVVFCHNEERYKERDRSN